MNRLHLIAPHRPRPWSTCHEGTYAKPCASKAFGARLGDNGPQGRELRGVAGVGQPTPPPVGHTGPVVTWSLQDLISIVADLRRHGIGLPPAAVFCCASGVHEATLPVARIRAHRYDPG
jgi:hypothetical protein